MNLVRRSSQRALDFLRDPSLAGDGRRPSARLREYVSRAEVARSRASTLEELVASCPWYHTIDLPRGVVTPGSYDHRELVRQIGLDDDLTGKRALDVATFDGFWAFELERRGAEVVALDVPSVADLDLPGSASDIVRREGLDLPLGTAFDIAHRALGSSVERVERSVYDLAPDDLGSFDLVHVGDLLLHLRHPLQALQRIRSVTAGQLVLTDCFEPSLSALPEPAILYRGGWQDLHWWLPSLEALAQMVVDAGFEHCEVRNVVRLPPRRGGDPMWRAVIHARP